MDLSYTDYGLYYLNWRVDGLSRLSIGITQNHLYQKAYDGNELPSTLYVRSPASSYSPVSRWWFGRRVTGLRRLCLE